MIKAIVHGGFVYTMPHRGEPPCRTYSPNFNHYPNYPNIPIGGSQLIMVYWDILGEYLGYSPNSLKYSYSNISQLYST